MSIFIFTIAILATLLVFSPYPPLARTCLYCGKKRPLINWITSLDKDYCDGCIDTFNEEIRSKKTKK